MTLIRLKDQSQSSPNTYIPYQSISSISSSPIIHGSFKVFFWSAPSAAPPKPLRGVPCTETPNSRGCCESRVEPVEPSQPTARVSQMMCHLENEPLQHSKYCEVVSCSKGISFHWSLWEEQAVKLTVFYPWTKRPQTQKERIVFQVFFRGYVELRGVVWVFSNRVAHIFQMVAKNH